MEDFYQQLNTDKASKPQRKKSCGLLNFLLAMFCTLFVICLFVIGFKLYHAKQEKNLYSSLAQIAGTAQSGSEQTAEAPKISREERFAQLLEQNPYFVGWLSIPDTQVNYPVVYTPDQPEFYLRRNFYGEKAVGGVPFLSAGCTEDGNSTIIHGHNMNNGTMFADILKYKDESFFAEHPTIFYDTLNETGAYDVMAAFYYDATFCEDPGHFDIYRYVGALNETDFNELLAQTSRLSLYNTDVTAEYGDELLILSTCSYHTENGRFLVMARKKPA